MISIILSWYIYTADRECVRWTWYGDVYNRTVICLEWREKKKKEVKYV